MKFYNVGCLFTIIIMTSASLMTATSSESSSAVNDQKKKKHYLGSIHQKRGAKLFKRHNTNNKDENAVDQNKKEQEEETKGHNMRTRRIKTNGLFDALEQHVVEQEQKEVEEEEKRKEKMIDIVQALLAEEKKKKKKEEETKSKTKQKMDVAEAEETEHVFRPAKPLEHYRDNLDPEVFEWFNKDHVRAGQQTCGYLHPPLSTSDNEPYPTIRVKFCMQFASVQPAPKGNVVLHCGGPGSLSSCSMNLAMGYDNMHNYNFITLDQRGLGMSWPSFAHEECTYGATTDVFGNLELTGLQTETVDAMNETTIKAFLRQQKKRASTCWTCETCDFHLEATDGSSKKYHFLQHSGTRQVAEDIELFRRVLGDETVSLFGVSYGTQVVATYATMFPEHVDLFVVDSNMPPKPDLMHLASTIAENTHHRASYMSYTCDIRNATAAGSCDIDLNYCFQTVFDYYTDVFHSIGAFDFERVFFAEFTEKSALGNFRDVCDASSKKDEVEFLNSLLKIEVDGPYITDPNIKACLPGIYEQAVALLDDIGTPASFTDKGSTRVGLAAYVLTFLADYDTCERFVQNAESPETRAALVHDLWEQEYEPLYIDGRRRRRRRAQEQEQELTEEDCTGPTFVHELYPFLVVSCSDGSITNAESDMKPYATIMGEPSNIPQTMVFGQSMSGSTYDENHVVQEVKEIYDKYGGALYGNTAAASFVFWYTLGYYWPQAQPVPPAGDIGVTGIVSGQLYDYVTAYKFTQEMKRAFPSTTLITSQWTQHGFMSAEATKHGALIDDLGDQSGWDVSTCQTLINRYFELGYVHVPDGHVCESRLPQTFQDFD